MNRTLTPFDKVLSKMKVATATKDERPCGDPRCIGGWLIEMENGYEVTLRCATCRNIDKAKRAKQLCLDTLPPESRLVFEHRPGRADAEEAIKRWVNNLGPLGIMVHGPAMTGITTLLLHGAAAIVRKGFASSVVYTTESQFKRAASRRLSSDDDGTSAKHVRDCTRADVLVFDLMGRGRRTETQSEAMCEMFEERMRYNKRTLIGTHEGFRRRWPSPDVRLRWDGANGIQGWGLTVEVGRG